MSVTLVPKLSAPAAPAPVGARAAPHSNSAHPLGCGAAVPPIVAEVWLSEADIVNADNTINWPTLNAIADRRARREQEACAKIGWLRDLSVLIAEEVAVLERSAAVMIECRQAREQIEQLPPRERLIRSLEFRLAKLKHGLGMPYDADAVAHYDNLLKQARAAAPDDAGVALADKLSQRAAKAETGADWAEICRLEAEQAGGPFYPKAAE